MAFGAQLTKRIARKLLRTAQPTAHNPFNPTAPRPGEPDFTDLSLPPEGGPMPEDLDDAELVDRVVNTYESVAALWNTLGYDDGDHFLEDNPGAAEAIQNFVAEQLSQNPEWRQKLVECLS